MDVIRELYSVVTDRKANPVEGSYTNYLFDKGTDKISKKVGEEAVEVVIAASQRKYKARGGKRDRKPKQHIDKKPVPRRRGL